MSDPGHSRQTFSRCFYTLSVTLPVVGPFTEADGDLSRANQAQGLISAVVNILPVIIDSSYDRAEDSPSTFHVIRQRHGKLEQVHLFIFPNDLLYRCFRPIDDHRLFKILTPDV